MDECALVVRLHSAFILPYFYVYVKYPHLTAVYIHDTISLMEETTHDHAPAEERTLIDHVLRAVAVLGLLAILLLGAWGIIQIAFTLPGFVGSFFDRSPAPAAQNIPAPTPESLTITAPTVATSGKTFTLSWKHLGADGSYGYQISYSCAQGLSMHVPLPNGTAQTVACNTPFNFTNAAEALTLTPSLSSTKQAPVTFTIFANKLSTGSVTAVGSTTLMILPAQSAPRPATQTNTPATTYVAAPRASTLHGSADLAVSIQSIYPANNGRYVLEFTVKNVGTNVSSKNWIFTAQLPLNPVYTYTAAPQQALYPGDKIVYVLGFTVPPTQNYNTGYTYPTTCGTYPYTYACPTNTTKPYGTVTVTVDPYNSVAETTDANNTATTLLP